MAWDMDLWDTTLGVVEGKVEEEQFPPLLSHEDEVDYSSFEGLEGTCEIGEPDPEFDLKGRGLYKPARMDGKSVVVDADLEDAVLVGSKERGIKSDYVAGGYHMPVIDVDVPMRIVPSTQEGHGHLYIDKVLSFTEYLHLLEAMVDVGLVEYGYLQGVRARGASYVRLPWVKKVEKK